MKTNDFIIRLGDRMRKAEKLRSQKSEQKGASNAWDKGKYIESVVDIEIENAMSFTNLSHA